MGIDLCQDPTIALRDIYSKDTSSYQKHLLNLTQVGNGEKNVDIPQQMNEKRKCSTLAQ